MVHLAQYKHVVPQLAELPVPPLLLVRQTDQPRPPHIIHAYRTDIFHCRVHQGLRRTLQPCAGIPCKSPAPLLLLQDVPPGDSSSSSDTILSVPSEPDSSEASSVSLHALVGDSDTNSIHLQGTIVSMALQFLVDSRATLNFIHTKWIPCLGLSLNTTRNFTVLVGNDDRMRCSGVCQGVTILIAGSCFVADLTPFQGAYVVLGVDWLKKLGPVTIIRR